MKLSDERIREIRSAWAAAMALIRDVSQWRERCHDYDDDMDNPRRDFSGDEDWEILEAAGLWFFSHHLGGEGEDPETAIPELLSEREEWEGVVKDRNILLDKWTRDMESKNNEIRQLRTRADALEKVLRDWALTARRLWGGGGGVHWKSFYAILDGKAVRGERGNFAGFCDIHPDAPLTIMDTVCEQCCADEHQKRINILNGKGEP